MNMMFGMLGNIQIQKYSRKHFGKLLIMHQWESGTYSEDICSRNLECFKRKLSVK